MPPQTLLTRGEVEVGAARGELPEWAASVFADFEQSMASRQRPFPCTFGAEAFRGDGLRYVFVDNPHDAPGLDSIRRSLAHFLSVSRRIHKYTSLVVMFKPLDTPLPVDAYRTIFWATLAYLHAHDPLPWPADVPTDPDHPDWEFCFAGEPTFVVCNTPAHVQRASRRSAGMIMTFQPRWVFDELRASPIRAQRATALIRTRLAKYDAAPISNALGAYGDPTNREWKQYFLADVEDGDVAQRCPLEITRGQNHART